MKLLIAADMEGISGVVDWIHVESTHAEYQRFRHIMTADINAAIKGATNVGVEEILVSDGHGYARNILIEELDSRARLNSGAPSPFSMVQGVDSGVDAAFFIGYHAHMSTQNAILAHTWSSVKVSNVWLNDKIVGEIGLNASLCGSFNVPVIMISGDQAAATEALEWIPGIVTSVIKKASGRQAAECLSLVQSHQLITASAETAIVSYNQGEAAKPLKTLVPVKIKIEFLNTCLTDSAAIHPNISRVDGRTVEFQCEDMPRAYRTFRSIVMMAG